MSKQILEMLVDYLSLKDIYPEYLGLVNGVEVLPKRDYPPCYYWVNTSSNNGYRISFNKTLIYDICHAIAKYQSLEFDDEIFNEVLNAYMDATSKVLRQLINQSLNDLLNPVKAE